MMDGTEHEDNDYMMQRKYQMHSKYCSPQKLPSESRVAHIFSPEQVSLNLAPDLFYRDHSAATAHHLGSYFKLFLSYKLYIKLF